MTLAAPFSVVTDDPGFIVSDANGVTVGAFEDFERASLVARALNAHARKEVR